jgi:7-carboxy-7-deazaguanine synthase
MKKGLKISEHFYSLQGEGKTMGVPSVFLRLTACNLLCDHKWTCDTIEVWTKGEDYTYDEVLDIFEKKGYQEKLFNGAHLVVTGGEPLIQQKQLIEFLEAYHERFFYLPYIEIETNGTKIPIKELNRHVNLYNVSPKLSNAGMSEKRRVVPEAIKEFNLIENSIFKFVVEDKEDWKELKKVYLTPFHIRKEKIYLMPAADDLKMLQKNSLYVSDLCKKQNLNYSSRLQIEIWNQTTGV